MGTRAFGKLDRVISISLFLASVNAAYNRCIVSIDGAVVHLIRPFDARVNDDDDDDHDGEAGGSNEGRHVHLCQFVHQVGTAVDYICTRNIV